MSKIKLTGSNSGYVEIDSAADAGNLTLSLPTSGTRLLSNTDNVFSGITTTGQLDINGSIDVSSTSVFNDDLTLTGASYNVVWDKSDNQLEFADNAKISLGSGGDMQLYHDGNHTHLHDSGSGVIYLRTNMLQVNNAANNQTFADFSSSAANLYSGNSRKFQTTNTGAVVTGILTATSFSGNGDALSYSSALSNRNVIINGAMLISQRGSDFTNVGSSGYYLDRCYWYDQNSSCRVRIRHSGLSPDGFHQSYRVNVTTADTSIASNEEVKLYQKIEGFNLQRFAKGTSGAKAFALSFYIKCNKNGTYIVEFYDRDNGRDVSGSYTVSNSNWNRHTIIFPADTSGEFNFDANSSLEISWWLVAGSAVQGGTLNTSWRNSTDPSSATGQVNFTDSTSNEWAMTGVQLETDFVTPYEHIPYGDELARCQRYYYTTRGGSNANPNSDSAGFFGVPLPNNSASGFGVAKYAVPMRATPTIVLYDGTATAGKFTQNGNNYMTGTAGGVQSNGFNLVTRSGGVLHSDATYSLTAGFTADAEL